MTEEELAGFEKQLFALAVDVDTDPKRVLAELPPMVLGFYGQGPIELKSEQAAHVLMNCAGVLIDSAMRVRDVAHLGLADMWLADVLESYQLEENAKAVSDALYFSANARIGLADIPAENAVHDLMDDGERPEQEVWHLAQALARWNGRDLLRDGRYNLTWSARILGGADPDGEGRRWCNLANSLDNSGRWVEAYDTYMKALEADRTNGNAAGNAAVLIGWAIGRGWDFEGHMCSLFDHYLTMAHQNRARTVEVAGEDAARRFDKMELLGTHASLRVEPATGDAYQAWVTKHRLALVAGLEGVGASDVEGRWDTINLNQVSGSQTDAGMPTILNILNVLKGDYLVARRLGFEASQAFAESDGWTQDEDDPGVYTDTLQYAVVGETSAKLVLAHRAALDVLDKTAVALNEHLGIGDQPDKVNFRTFWFEPEKKTENRYNTLRASLLAHTPITLQVLAMAELAYDMTVGGIHADAQKVRNAGTHRFVMLHQGLHEVDSTLTMQAIPVREMVDTMLESLSVARAAFIYLVDMLSAVEADKFIQAEEAGATWPKKTLPMMNTL